MVLSYEDLTKTLNKMLEGYRGKDLDTPLTAKEFSEIINFDISEQLEDTRNISSNEYGTEDVTIDIKTITENKEDITVTIVLEVDNGMITHISDVDEY